VSVAIDVGRAVSMTAAVTLPPIVPGYRIERLLGQGGFGSVWLARAVDGTSVALKVAHAGQLARGRLEREASAYRAVGPPHTPALLAHGATEDGLPYIALELIAAPTLRECLRREGVPLRASCFAAWADALVVAVQAAHERGTIHRDLKPENVCLVTEHPARAILLDFGLARHEPGGASELTATAPIIGTAAYMSPEQCSGGQGAADARTDVYSLGVIFFEMLTGQLPFAGSAAEIRDAHISRRAPAPSRLTPVHHAIEDIVLRCLAKDPQRRFPSAWHLQGALAGAVAEASAEVQTSTPKTAPAAPDATRAAEPFLVFFRSDSDAGALQSVVHAFGGAMGHASDDRFAFVFERDGNDAVAAARALLRGGLTKLALLDKAAINRQRRPDGSVRYLGPVFRRPDRYPDGDGGLLATNDAARYLPPDLGNTRDTVGSLSRLEAGVATTLDARAPASPSKGPRARLLGRDDELGSLLEAVRCCASQRLPTVATVIAEPGLGKTHLAQALAARLRSERVASVLEVRAPDPATCDIDGTLRAVLRVALDAPRRAPDGGARGYLDARLGTAVAEECWPAVASALGWLPRNAEELAPLRVVPGALQGALVRATSEALRRRASRGPVVVLLDDGQFADGTALDALECAALADCPAPICVIVFARPEFEVARPAWGSRAGSGRVVALLPLERRAAADLCRALLRPAEDVPEDAVGKLVDRTQGIPLLLVELVRALHQAGAIRRRQHGEAYFLATDTIDSPSELPLVDWLAQRELGSLSEAMAIYARLASLLDAEFSELEVEGVVTEMERHGSSADLSLDAGVAVHRLVARGLLTRTPHGVVRFRHALVRDAVSRTVPHELRILVHRAALNHYRARRDRDEATLAKLAHHAAESGYVAEAGAFFLSLAESARARHAYFEAEMFYTRALALLPASRQTEHARASRGRGLMRYRIGRHEDALSDLEHARELARALEDRLSEVEILLDQATALDWTSRFERSRELVEEARGLSIGAESAALEAQLCHGEGRSRWRAGPSPEAIEGLERAAQLARVLGDAGYETLVSSLLMLEMALAQCGRIADGETVAVEVIELCASRADRVHLVAALNNRLQLSLSAGNLERALADLERSFGLARELGVVRMLYVAHYNLALVLHDAGRTDEAWPHVQRAVALEDPRFGLGGPPVAAVLQARLLAYAQRREEARAVLERVTVAQRGVADGGGGELLGPDYLLLLRVVDLVTRCAREEEWTGVPELAREQLTVPERVEVTELRALAAAAAGDRGRAQQLLDEAIVLSSTTPTIMRPRLEAHIARLQAME